MFPFKNFNPLLLSQQHDYPYHSSSISIMLSLLCPFSINFFPYYPLNFVVEPFCCIISSLTPKASESDTFDYGKVLQCP